MIEQAVQISEYMHLEHKFDRLTIGDENFPRDHPKPGSNFLPVLPFNSRVQILAYKLAKLDREKSVFDAIHNQHSKLQQARHLQTLEDAISLLDTFAAPAAITKDRGESNRAFSHRKKTEKSRKETRKSVLEFVSRQSKPVTYYDDADDDGNWSISFTEWMQAAPQMLAEVRSANRLLHRLKENGSAEQKKSLRAHFKEEKLPALFFETYPNATEQDITRRESGMPGAVFIQRALNALGYTGATPESVRTAYFRAKRKANN